MEESLTDAAEQRFPELQDIPRLRRRRLVVKLVGLIQEELDDGQTDAEAIRRNVHVRFTRDGADGVSPIILIVIGELIAWLVRRILDRYFPRPAGS